MAKYVFVYHGGKPPQDPEAVAKVMAAWTNWFTGMGEDVIDGGCPVGMSTTVHGDGSVSDDGGSNPASGYSLISASNLDDAINKAQSCPILEDGGSVELAEAFDMS